MKIKTTLLAAFLISQPILADAEGEFFWATSVVSAILGFGLNISPSNNKDLLINNAIGIYSTAMFTRAANKALSLPGQKEIINDASIEPIVLTIALVYAASAGLSRVCNKLATNNVKHKNDCPCGKTFAKKDEYLKHLLDHGFKIEIPEIIS